MGITLYSTFKILRGRGSTWDAQDREGAAIPWSSILSTLGWYGLIAAIVPIIYVAADAPSAALASLPFFGSLVFALPVAKYTSAPKNGAGDWVHKHKLFMSPYEDVPEVDLDGAEAKLQAQLASFEQKDKGGGKDTNTDTAQDDSTDTGIDTNRRTDSSIASLNSLSSLSERMTSWRDRGNVRIGMRHNQLLSVEREAFEAAIAERSNALPLSSLETS